MTILSLVWREALIRLASALAFIREYAGPNAGEGVQAMQASTGNKSPDFWCMSFVYYCVRRMLGKVLLRSASCSEQRAYARKKGALRTRAEFDAAVKNDPGSVLGWVFLIIDTTAASRPEEKAAGLAGHAHHTGLVGWVQPDDVIVGAFADTSFVSTEGNAADPEKPSSRDGNGAYGGRLRGNRAPKEYHGRTYKADSTTYEFIDLEAM